MDQFSTDPLNELSSDDLASQRNGSRDSLLLSAQLRTADGVDVTVRVRNLSSGGLMAEYSQPITQGTPVEVEVRGVGWINGRIAWTAEGRIGIAFEREIDPMAARKPVAAGRSSPVAKPVRRAF
jgi:hypothetical protein